MKKYDRIKNLSPEEFRRLTGIKPLTFQEMVEIDMARTGIEPATQGFSVLCSTD